MSRKQERMLARRELMERVKKAQEKAEEIKAEEPKNAPAQGFTRVLSRVFRKDDADGSRDSGS